MIISLDSSICQFFFLNVITGILFVYLNRTFPIELKLSSCKLTFIFLHFWAQCPLLKNHSPILRTNSPLFSFYTWMYVMCIRKYLLLLWFQENELQDRLACSTSPSTWMADIAWLWSTKMKEKNKVTKTWTRTFWHVGSYYLIQECMGALQSSECQRFCWIR